MAKGGLFFLGIIIIISAGCCSPARAEISGQLKYTLENNYLNQAPTQQIFTQDYLTRLRGAMLEDRIGNYQLELRYQKGATELRSFAFSNTLNFREAVQLSGSFSRRDYGNLDPNNNSLAENRLALTATYFAPTLPSLTFAYESGDSRSASSEGKNRSDGKATAGFSYSRDQTTVSAQYSKKVLNDNNALAPANNYANKEDSFTITGLTGLGEKIQLTGNYFDQQATNQLGDTSLYSQRLQNFSVQGKIKALPYLTLKPGYSGNLNFIDYLVPAGQKNHQQSQRSSFTASFTPHPQAELGLTVGGGPLEFDDPQGFRRQFLFFQQATIDLNLEQKFLVNINLEGDTYSGSGEGTAGNFRVYCSYFPRENLKLTYKKNATSYVGSIYPLGSGGVRNQDTNEGLLEIGLNRVLSFLGGLSSAWIDPNRSNAIYYGLKYLNANSLSWELRREDKLGTETSQTIFSRTDSLQARLPFNNLLFNLGGIWLTNTITAGTSTNVLYGFRANVTVNYWLGDSSLNLTVNSERQDQNSNEYTRTYLSFTRNF